MLSRLKSNGQLDFSNPKSIKQLTKALLKKDFGLKIELPDDRLCPPVCQAPFSIIDFVCFLWSLYLGPESTQLLVVDSIASRYDQRVLFRHFWRGKTSPWSWRRDWSELYLRPARMFAASKMEICWHRRWWQKSSICSTKYPNQRPSEPYQAT